MVANQTSQRYFIIEHKYDTEANNLVQDKVRSFVNVWLLEEPVDSSKESGESPRRRPVQI